jgi:serine-type D-Ala-D-Ala carboxypeptidase (penicillin-binding protein 5/6)
MATGLTLQIVIVGLASADLSPPPPTPVAPDGHLSPFPSTVETPAHPERRPAVGAQAAVLADLTTGTVMFQKAPDAPRPIASLTKIMTALLVLRRSDLHDVVRVDPRAVFAPDDYGATSTIGLRAGERLTVGDLLDAMVLGSANDAAEALAIHVGGTVDRFVALMNAQAKKLGMRDTVFRSPNGLDDRGRSTPRDLLTLMRAADATPGFTSITSRRFVQIPSPHGKPRRIQNRNVLLWLYPGAFGTKTGSTALAGSCLVASAERDGRRLVAIVLHAPAEAFSDAATLLNYGFEGFSEEVLVREGEDAGVVRLRGGEVSVAATKSLRALVPTDAVDRISHRVDVVAGAAFPPAPGEVVATMTVSVPGLTLARVPLEVSQVPPPPPADGSLWWGRALGAVGHAVTDAVGAFAD